MSEGEGPQRQRAESTLNLDPRVVLPEPVVVVRARGTVVIP